MGKDPCEAAMFILANQNITHQHKGAMCSVKFSKIASQAKLSDWSKQRLLPHFQGSMELMHKGCISFEGDFIWWGSGEWWNQ